MRWFKILKHILCLSFVYATYIRQHYVYITYYISIARGVAEATPMFQVLFYKQRPKFFLKKYCRRQSQNATCLPAHIQLHVKPISSKSKDISQRLVVKFATNSVWLVQRIKKGDQKQKLTQTELVCVIQFIEIIIYPLMLFYFELLKYS